MTVEQYRAELVKALQAAVDESTGRKTWTAQDIAQIMKSQTDSVLKNAMKYNTPSEYAYILSM